jgi:serine/threonine protein kinase
MNKIGRYSIKKKIGSGGMATIYLARDDMLGRDVAMKVLHPHLAESEKSIKRFENEAATIASLSHENIIKLFDFGHSDDKCFLVMEFVEGMTIHELIERNGPLPSLATLAMFLQIYSGLSEAHEKGFCHRDIKPSNIMVDRHGCIKIMDFGIAHLLQSESITMTGAFMGSPNFMSPEQIRGKKVTEKTDIFSAGLVLYMCATGQAAFSNENINTVFYAIEKTQPQPPFSLNSKLLPCIATLIEKCIQKDPVERPDSVACLAMIEEFCRSDQLYVKKERVAQLVQTGFAYKKLEDDELFGLYRNKARDSYRLGKRINSLREFAIAGCFGELDGLDLKIIKKVSIQRKFLKYAFSGCGILCCLILICASVVWLMTHGHFREKTDFVSRQPHSAYVPILIDSNKEDRNTGDKTAVATMKNTNSSTTVSRRISPDFRTTVRHNAKNTVPVSAPVPAKARPGFLKVKTSPPWSKIYVDGIYFGDYPVTSIIPMASGSHTIVVKKEGFRDAALEIILAPNDTITKRIELAVNPEPR